MQFQIKAPGINTTELSNEMESQIQKAQFSEEEIRMVEKLDFRPVSPIDELSFNPPLTCELFERPVAMPDFSSRKYPLLKGPVGYFIKKAYKYLFMIFERNSRNKVQAFNNVVHELLYMRHRIKNVETHFTSNLDSNKDNLKNTPLVFTQPALQFLLEAIFTDYIANTNKPLLLLDDQEGHYLNQALKSGFQTISANSQNTNIIQSCINKKGLEIQQGQCDDLFLSQKTGQYANCIVCDLGNYSGDISNLYQNLTKSIQAKGMLYLVHLSKIRNTGFTWNNRYQIDKDETILTLKENGFEFIDSKEIEGMDDQSFILILKKL